MNTTQIKEQIKKLPSGPGIYLFKGAGHKPIYIGKALNLKNRVGHYLKTKDSRLKRMILEAQKVDFIQTDNDIEALIIESRYIKKYNPDFNIMLRDDKQYFFVGFSVEKFPKIFLTHQPFDSLRSLRASPKTEFVGPFTDGSAIKTTLRLLRRIFPYCTCKQLHNNYCLHYHIDKCLGFCCLKDSPERRRRIVEEKIYFKNVEAIRDVLLGKKSSLIKKLEKEMKTLSDKQEYEKALQLQYKIKKLKRVFQNAQVIQNQKTDNTSILKELQNILKLKNLPRRIEAYDIANIQGKYAVGAMAVFTNGEPDKNKYRKFKIHNVPTSQVGTLDDISMLKEVITRRFNHSNWPYPDLIIVDGGKAQFNAAKNVSKKIPIIALTKNEKHIGHKIIIADDKKISLSKLPAQTKNLLLYINSEAHRFAIGYYRKLHRKNMR